LPRKNAVVIENGRSKPCEIAALAELLTDEKAAALLAANYWTLQNGNLKVEVPNRRTRRSV
jgi:hypothetical protein